MRKTGLSLLMALALLLALTTAAAAQDYPSKPVRLIVAFPPGGSNDVVARIVTTPLGGQHTLSVACNETGAADLKVEQFQLSAISVR